MANASVPDPRQPLSPVRETPAFTEAPPLPVRFILLHPRDPRNLGAAARALKNFGFSDWVIVGENPMEAHPDDARRLAVHAGSLLDHVRCVPDFGSAVRDCCFITGTSSRHFQGRGRLSPEEWACAAARLGSGSRAAIVFGEERSGLSNAEIERCHALSTIPSLPGQPSLNLAQAILLYAYEARKASMARADETAPEAEGPLLATDAALERIGGSLREVLSASGFLLPGREETAVSRLMSPVYRACLRKREGSLAEAALRCVLRALTQETKPPRPAAPPKAGRRDSAPR